MFKFRERSSNIVPVKIVKMYDDVDIPEYKTKGAACFDLRAYLPQRTEGKDYTVIKAGNMSAIGTGLRICIPEGFELQIRPRSGLFYKHYISVGNTPGTIDSDYRDEIKVLLENRDPYKNDFKVYHGDRIAQAKLSRVWIAKIECVKEFSDKDMEKDRGGGFGSTGKN